jgi:hypothetical protein
MLGIWLVRATVPVVAGNVSTVVPAAAVGLTVIVPDVEPGITMLGTLKVSSVLRTFAAERYRLVSVAAEPSPQVS